jgi:outer membrane protein TolC
VNIKDFGLLILIFFNGCAPVFAVTEKGNAQAKKISWNELKQETRSGSLDIQAQKQSQESAEQKLKSAWGKVSPSVSVSATKYSNNAKVSDTQTDTTTDDKSAQVSLPLFTGFANSSNILKNQALLDVTKAQAKSTEIEIRYKLRVAYINFYTALELQKLYENLIKRQKNNVDLLRLKYKAGVEALWSYQQVEAELQNNEQIYQNQIKAQRQALEELKKLSSIDNDFFVQIENDYFNSKAKNYNFDLLNHPKYIEAQSRIAAAEHNVTFTQSQFYPQVKAYYKLSETKTGSGSSDKVENRQVGVGLEWKIFDGFQDFHNVQVAKAERLIEETQLRNVAQNLKLSYTKAAEDYTSAWQLLPILGRSVEAAQGRLMTVYEQYKAGLRSYIEWEQAESRATESQKSLIRGREQALISQALLEKEVGLTLEDE